MCIIRSDRSFRRTHKSSINFSYFSVDGKKYSKYAQQRDYAMNRSMSRSLSLRWVITYIHTPERLPSINQSNSNTRLIGSQSYAYCVWMNICCDHRCCDMLVLAIRYAPWMKQFSVGRGRGRKNASLSIFLSPAVSIFIHLNFIRWTTYGGRRFIEAEKMCRIVSSSSGRCKIDGIVGVVVIVVRAPPQSFMIEKFIFFSQRQSAQFCCRFVVYINRSSDRQ